MTELEALRNMCQRAQLTFSITEQHLGSDITSYYVTIPAMTEEELTFEFDKDGWCTSAYAHSV